MNDDDARLPTKGRKTIEASEFLMVSIQLQIKSDTRNADPGLAAAYAEFGVLIQDTATEARSEGTALLNLVKPEAALAGGRK